MLIKYNDDLPTRKSISKLCFIHYTSFKIKEKKSVNHGQIMKILMNKKASYRRMYRVSYFIVFTDHKFALKTMNVNEKDTVNFSNN